MSDNPDLDGPIDTDDAIAIRDAIRDAAEGRDFADFMKGYYLALADILDDICEGDAVELAKLLKKLDTFHGILMRAGGADATPEESKFTEEQANNLAEKIVGDVCEIPDRNSPEGQPEMMLVSDQELFNIVLKHLLPE